MRTNRYLAPRLLSLIALGVLASPAFAGGCGGNSNVTPPKKSEGGTSGSGGSRAGRGGTSGSATGGTSGRGGNGGKGAQGGTMNVDDGGASGEAAGGTSGGVTAGTGGAATGGSAGKAEAGGSAGMSAGGSQGGSAAETGGSAGTAGPAGNNQGGTAGQGGSAGNGTAGMVGALGTPCSPPGALACAGNYQKLTVLCGGNGEWQPNQTCGADLYCDSTPGPNVGLCAPVAEGCEEGAGIVYCSEDEKRIVTCGPDAVTKSEETCEGACHRGVCRDDATPCPEWDEYDDVAACAKDCGEPTSADLCFVSDGCYREINIRAGNGTPSVVRTPWSDDACACEMGEGRSVWLDVSKNGPLIRVMVPAPWSIGSCGQDALHCAVVGNGYVQIWTPEPDSGPVNLTVEEAFSSAATCPNEGG
jgi:hypothetical protein